MKLKPITEAWQADIVARDSLRAATTFSFIANTLYPEMQYARDREAKLAQVPEMARLRDILQGRTADLRSALRAWESKAA